MSEGFLVALIVIGGAPAIIALILAALRLAGAGEDEPGTIGHILRRPLSYDEQEVRAAADEALWGRDPRLARLAHSALEKLDKAKSTKCEPAAWPLRKEDPQ